MTETQAQYGHNEPPVDLLVRMPAALFETLTSYAEKLTDGDTAAMALRCLYRELEPQEAARLEALSDARSSGK